MKNNLSLFSFLLAALGALFLYAAGLHSLLPSVPVVGGFAEMLQDFAKTALGFRGPWRMALAGAGGVAFVAAALLLVRAKKEAEKAEDKDANAGPSAAAAAALESDENNPLNLYKKLQNLSSADEAEEVAITPQERVIFSDTSAVVAMMHGNLPAEKTELILRVLRPDLAKYADQMEPAAKGRICRQLLTHFILVAKRTEKNISPDQYRIQDQRRVEVERETIARRFMPRESRPAGDEHASKIGKVYAIIDGANLQQKTNSGAEDWQDISLLNIAEVMKKPA